MSKFLKITAAAIALTFGSASYAAAGPNGFKIPEKKPGGHGHLPGGYKPGAFKYKPGPGGYKPGPVGYKPGWGKGYGYGYGGMAAAGLVGGLALGAMAASAGPAYAEEGCYTIRRRYVDEYGDVFVRRVAVCD